MLKDLVVKNEEPEDLATAVRKISAAVTKMGRSGINRQGIIVLLCHSTRLGAGTVKRVLDGLGELERQYTVRQVSTSKAPVVGRAS